MPTHPLHENTHTHTHTHTPQSQILNLLLVCTRMVLYLHNSQAEDNYWIVQVHILKQLACKLKGKTNMILLLGSDIKPAIDTEDKKQRLPSPKVKTER